MITIYFNGNAIPINESTAKRFGLKNGHIVKSEKEFYDILNGKLIKNVTAQPTAK